MFHALSGLDPVSRYFYRIYGYAYALIHIGRFVKAAGQYLRTTDREAMSADELAQSLAREAEVKRITTRRILPMMLKVLSPFYDPAKRREPEGYRAFLDSLEQRRATAA